MGIENLVKLFPEELVVDALERELLLKKSRYEETARKMREKYGMEFKRAERELLKAENYSWEVERDLIEWEHAEEGIKSCTELLEEIKKWKTSPVSDR